MVDALPKAGAKFDITSDFPVNIPLSSSSNEKIPVIGANPAALETL